ncbi:upstream stimulatory factor-like isoform X2 [Antedon mediterranea]|uniref:upstream stimulatory factor-like isoform X2 n=1 Tax=Antedon mediterranea TaxID=105859 RepID=UPI003AF7AC8A
MDLIGTTLDTGTQDKSDSDLEKDPTIEISHGDGDNGVTGADDGSSVMPGGNFGDNIQYQFRTDNNGQGPVTYRVVQVNDGGSPNTMNVVTTTSFPHGQQAVTQAVIQSPFNGDSPTSETQTGETRFTYFPAAAVSGDAITSSGTSGQASTNSDSASLSQSGGQFYVMMSPQDVLQNASQRTIAPRTQYTPKLDTGRTARDERRRATHNEVERRRRDKINNWIVKLSKLVPDCNQDHTKQGQQSKGGILSKTVDYIQDLRNANARMAESVKETERLSVDNELLRQQLEELKHENNLLRAQQGSIEITN